MATGLILKGITAKGLRFGSFSLLDATGRAFWLSPNNKLEFRASSVKAWTDVVGGIRLVIPANLTDNLTRYPTIRRVNGIPYLWNDSAKGLQDESTARTNLDWLYRGANNWTGWFAVIGSVTAGVQTGWLSNAGSSGGNIGFITLVDNRQSAADRYNNFRPWMNQLLVAPGGADSFLPDTVTVYKVKYSLTAGTGKLEWFRATSKAGGFVKVTEASGPVTPYPEGTQSFKQLTLFQGVSTYFVGGIGDQFIRNEQGQDPVKLALEEPKIDKIFLEKYLP